MLKWVTTAGVNGNQQKSPPGNRQKSPTNENNSNSCIDDQRPSLEITDTSKANPIVSPSPVKSSGDESVSQMMTSNPDSPLSEKFNSSLATKRLSSCYSTSGEADSLLDHTSDSLNDEFAPHGNDCITMDTDRQMDLDRFDKCSHDEGNESRSPTKGIVICHGKHCDSGISSTGSQEADESCYNSGTDTSFDTTPTNTQVTIDTSQYVKSAVDQCNEQNTKVEKGNTKSKNYCSQTTADNGLINKLHCLEINSQRLSSHEHKSEKPKLIERGNSDSNTIHCDIPIEQTNKPSVAQSEIDECGISVDFSSDDSDEFIEGYASDTDTLDAVFESEATNTRDILQVS